MQDFHPLPDRIFSAEEGAADGGGGEGELHRLVGYPAAASASRQPTPPQQPVKCPRCDSTNTKFCYYNNYNLAQPRHFCKSCRRYWTMGGVLRNVPVGGGCRKSKRPSSSSKPSSLPSPASADKDHPRRRRPAASASSLTPGTTVIASASFPDPPLPTSQIPISNTDAPLHPAPAIFQDPAAGVFSETPAALLGFGFPDPSPAGEKTEAEAIGPDVTHPTVPADLQPIGAGDGLAALDLSGPVDPGLFDLTTTVDPSAYWNQSHWMDADPSLYLPRLGVGRSDVDGSG